MFDGVIDVGNSAESRNDWTVEDWEKFLNVSEGNVDEELGLVTFETKTTIDNSLDNFNASSGFIDKIKKIEIAKNIEVKIDEKKKSLSLYDNENGDIIGEICLSEYRNGDFFRKIHLYNVVEEKYRGKGWGKFLFELYMALSNENSEFILPDQEYTNVVSMVNLYKKFGYVPKYKIVNGIDETIELNNEDYELFSKNIANYKAGYKEKKLPYTIILDKEF